jgi:hypothetical protein
MKGTLLDIKASLTGDEPADVLNYARAHTRFPHQSTIDQFFTESQFESYRILGYHVGRKVFYEAAEGIRRKREASSTPAIKPSSDIAAPELFGVLETRWHPSPPEFDRRFLDSTQSALNIEQALPRKDVIHEG